MKVLLLWSTGRTGKLILDQLLQQGYSINIMVRDKTKTGPHSEKVQVFEGQPTDKETLLLSAQGCEGIISVL